MADVSEVEMGIVSVIVTLVPIAQEVIGDVAEAVAGIRAAAAAQGYYADTVILEARIAEDARRKAISETEAKG
jgi:hypothetical protein